MVRVGRDGVAGEPCGYWSLEQVVTEVLIELEEERATDPNGLRAELLAGKRGRYIGEEYTLALAARAVGAASATRATMQKIAGSLPCARHGLLTLCIGRIPFLSRGARPPRNTTLRHRSGSP